MKYYETTIVPGKPSVTYEIFDTITEILEVAEGHVGDYQFLNEWILL